MVGHTKLIIGLYGVFLHGDFDGNVQKSVALKKSIVFFIFYRFFFLDVLSVSAFFVFRHFLEHQGSYEAETWTTRRSRACCHFGLCTLGATVAKKIEKIK